MLMFVILGAVLMMTSCGTEAGSLLDELLSGISNVERISNHDVLSNTEDDLDTVDLLEIERRTVLSPSSLSNTQKQSVVDEHNTFRSQEGSSNMMFMYWDEDLASYAQEWADRCDMNHGQVQAGDPPFKQMGQNLYYRSSEYSVDYALKRFHDEKNYLDFKTMFCDGPTCGHYTQLVWAKTEYVGCGMTYCADMTEGNKNLPSGYYFVCNYGPAGNVLNKEIMKKGPACTECSTEKFSCYNGLCRDCAADGVNCNCAADCKNCADVTADCRCSCKPGWMGASCSETCRNTDRKCGKGWRRSKCTHRKYGAKITNKCPLMCGKCQRSDGNDVCAARRILDVLTSGRLE